MFGLTCAFFVFGSSAGLGSGGSQSDIDLRTARSLHAEGVELSKNHSEADRRLAIERFLSAIELLDELGEPLLRGATLLELGSTYARLGELKTATETLKSALRSFPESSWEKRAQALNNLGVVLNQQGMPAQALSYLEEALRLREERADAGAVGSTLNNLARAYKEQGEFERAADLYRRAMTLRKQAEDHRGVAVVLINLAALQDSLGRKEEALLGYQEALALLRAGNHKSAEAIVLNDLGFTHLSLGDFATAIAFFEESLSIRVEIGDRAGEARSLSNLGATHVRTGSLELASESHLEALRLFEELENRKGIALSLHNLGRLEMRRGNWNAAEFHLARALKLREGLTDLEGKVVTQESLARCLSNTRRDTKAVAMARSALATADQLESPRLRIATRYLLADLLRDQEEPRAAFVLATEAVEILDEYLDSIRTAPLRASLLASERDVYDLYLALLLQEPRVRAERAERAFEVVEGAKALGLASLLGEHRSQIRSGIDETLLHQETALASQILRTESRLAEGDASLSEADLTLLRSRYQHLRAQIRSSAPGFAALFHSGRPSVADVRQQLVDPDTVLLSYYLGDDESYGFALTSERLDLAVLPPRPEIEKRARALHELLRLPGHALTAGRYERLRTDLVEMLLDPLRGALEEHGTVFVIPDGALHYLPFQTIWPDVGRDDSRQPRAVVRLPSAGVGVLLRQRAARGERRGGTLVALGDPIFGPDDPRMAAFEGNTSTGPSLREELREGLPRLLHSEAEVEGVASLLPVSQSTKVLGSRATKAFLGSQDARRARWLHLATHAVVDTTHPELSALVLSGIDETGKAVDGRIRLLELYNLSLNAELVTLSACETALGAEIRAEGLVGLVHGFFHAGASSVLASLWPVDDESTAILMASFYRGLLVEGMSGAEALARARQVTANDARFRDPHHWAGFVLIGSDPRSPATQVGQ